jgi:hypothetical protein
MHKFATALSVANTATAFPTTPQFILGDAVRTKADAFTKYGLSLMWRTGVRIIYSFDGVNDHGDVEDATLNEGLMLDGVSIPLGAIWFRVASGTTSAVRVEVWSQ